MNWRDDGLANSTLYCGTWKMCYTWKSSVDNKWHVRLFCIDDEEYSFDGLSSLDEAKWQSTLLMEKECRKIEDKYRQIRNNLPDKYELYEKTLSNKEKL